MSDRHRAVTHNPTVALARAMRRQSHVRILLRSFSETLPSEWIEGWVARFEGDQAQPTRVVISLEPPGPEVAERIVRIDRVALVEEILESGVQERLHGRDDGEGERKERATLPAPEPSRANTPVSMPVTSRAHTPVSNPGSPARTHTPVSSPGTRTHTPTSTPSADATVRIGAVRITRRGTE